jgi:hypothetical protein
LRFTILQPSHRFLTDAWTFIAPPFRVETLALLPYFRHNAPPTGVVGREFDPYTITGEEAHQRQREASAGVRHNLTPVIECHPEERTR